MRLFFLAAGLAVLVWLIVDLGPGRILEMLGRVGWHAFAIVAIYSAYQAVRAFALVSSVSGPPRLTWRGALAIRISGEAVQFLTFSGPFLSEPAKALLLERHGLTRQEGFSATLTEYLVNTFVGAVFAIAALVWLLTLDTLPGAARTAVTVVIVVLAAFLLAAALAIVRRVHLLGAILERAIALPGVRTRVRVDMAAVHATEDILLGILHDRPRRFARIAALQTGSHALHFLELFTILAALDLAPDFRTTFVIEGATKVVGIAFFFVPAQVGAAEGSYTLVFAALDLPLAAGVAVPFIRRLRMFALSAAGVTAIWWATRRRSG